MKAIHDIINYLTSTCPLKSRKCGNGKKLQKFEYLENEKNILDKIKSIFHRFWRAFIWLFGGEKKDKKYRIQALNKFVPTKLYQFRRFSEIVLGGIHLSSLRKTLVFSFFFAKMNYITNIFLNFHNIFLAQHVFKLQT